VIMIGGFGFQMLLSLSAMHIMWSWFLLTQVTVTSLMPSLSNRLPSYTKNIVRDHSWARPIM
jgi:hypothetical protein